jgi:hypothetical protein
MQCASGPCAVQGIAVEIAEDGAGRALSVSTIWLDVEDETP